MIARVPRDSGRPEVQTAGTGVSWQCLQTRNAGSVSRDIDTVFTIDILANSNDALTDLLCLKQALFLLSS